jgi:hypothetical protein
MTKKAPKNPPISEEQKNMEESKKKNENELPV